MCLYHVAIRTTKPNNVPSHLRGQSHQLLIDLTTQDHPNHFQCLCVSDTQSLFKVRRDVQLLQPCRDGWPSTMDEDDLYPQFMQPDEILQHCSLVFQGTPA